MQLENLRPYQPYFESNRKSLKEVAIEYFDYHGKNIAPFSYYPSMRAALDDAKRILQRDKAEGTLDGAGMLGVFDRKTREGIIIYVDQWYIDFQKKHGRDMFDTWADHGVYLNALIKNKRTGKETHYKLGNRD